MAQDSKKEKLAADVWAKYRRSRRKLESSLSTPVEPPEPVSTDAAAPEHAREYVLLPTLH